MTIAHKIQARSAVNDLFVEKLLPSGALSPVLTDCTVGNPSFYLLPKIHKQDFPGTPIVSVCSCSTVHLSDFHDNIFQL
jgi:hypothetical protein